jgi:hypothetical protein
VAAAKNASLIVLAEDLAFPVENGGKISACKRGTIRLVCE